MPLRVTEYKKSLSDRIFDSKPVVFFFDWILRPVIFTAGIYLIGVLVLTVADQLFNSNWLNSIPGWERWLASLLMGLLATGFWEEAKGNSHKDTY